MHALISEHTKVNDHRKVFYRLINNHRVDKFMSGLSVLPRGYSKSSPVLRAFYSNESPVQ